MAEAHRERAAAHLRTILAELHGTTVRPG
jgi:hypothetical protein